jgi:hypothetical protein
MVLKVGFSIDGQKMILGIGTDALPFLEKVDGKWRQVSDAVLLERVAITPEKRSRICGPIDDAFRESYWIVKPSKEGWHASCDQYAQAAVDQFAAIWDRYFRGTLSIVQDSKYEEKFENLVLFGDPQSNSLIAKVLPRLPITWTKEKLVVNGVEYDSKTHIPVLIYPNPLNANQNYVVLNSGHTFKEADLKGTNALLYPRLGDWAVIKPTPTEKDPAAYEVVAAGLFDENWQFPKK